MGRKLFVGLMASMLFLPNVFAANCTEDSAGAQAEIDFSNGSKKYCTAINDAFSESTEGATVKLLENITNTEVTAVKNNSPINLTFDLNGHSITSSIATYGTFYIAKGVTLTIVDTSVEKTGKIENTNQLPALVVQEGTGIIKGGLYTTTNTTQSTIAVGLVNHTEYDGKASLVFEDGATVDGSYGIGVFGENQKLTVNGGVIKAEAFAVAGNGRDTKNSTIIINGGNLTSTGNAAIYQPQTGTLTINNGNITGKVGIVARQGTVSVVNGNITANGTAGETINTGDAVKDGKKIDIPSGVGIIVDNTESTYPNVAKVEVKGGDFTTNDGGVLAYGDESDNATDEIVVIGGKFNQDVGKKYLSAQTSQSVSGVVGKVYNITAGPTENGTIAVNSNAAVGEVVALTLTPSAGYEVGEIKITTEDGTVIPVSADNTFVMPEGNVLVTVTYKTIVLDEVLATNPDTFDNAAIIAGLALLSTGILAVAIKKVMVD